MSLRAIILTGGRSSRFAGVHKPGVELAGRTVISRILATVRDADPLAEVVVAGRADGLDAEEAETVAIVR
ncbi:molybdenum cofactor guanylyltransferase, partial [Burkholderia multivorans]